MIFGKMTIISDVTIIEIPTTNVNSSFLAPHTDAVAIAAETRSAGTARRLLKPIRAKLSKENGEALFHLRVKWVFF